MHHFIMDQNVPLIFSVSHSGELHVRTALPGLMVELSADGGGEWKVYIPGVIVPYDSMLHLRDL